MSSFFADPQRDASDVIAGFVYQIDVTVQRWLGLKDGEVLELERGEDLDLVKVDGDGLPGTRVLEQLKRRSTSAISLKSPDALTAIARFCEHRKNNPADRLRFRFLSTAGVATERAWNGQGTAISTWQSIQRGQLSDADQEKGLDDIRNFLETCSAPDGVSSEAWALVTDLLKKENASELIEVIGSFEWGLGSTDYPKVETEVKVALIQGGLAENEAVADSIFERLFLFVFKRVSETGIKRLTLTDLKTQLELPTLTFRDKAFLTFIDDLRGLGRRIERLESQSEITSQVVLALGDKTSALEERIALGMSISVPRPSFDRPALITPILPRTESVENILGQLTKSSWINVIGEPGSGKTQLCLLTTERSGRDTFWINLRGCSPEQACDVIDRALELASRIPFSPFLSRWYQQATSSLGAGKIFVLDDLPRVASGGALAQRLGLLAAATKSNGQQILSASYYPLPNQIAETHELFEISSPRFEVADVSELLRAAGAPEGFPTEQIADFLVALTGGLPLMVAAAARILQAHNWTIGRETLESFFGGGYARGLKTDAQAMIESTVPNAETRELLYRLSVVIGPFTKQQVETISKVDQKIRLAGEKLEQLIGLWIQPYATETFRLSPLIEASLAQRLDSDTRTGVHAVLALDLLKRKITTVLDVMTCIHHFQTAELTGHAADVLMKALLPITQTDQEVPNERLLLSVWNPGPLPSTINLNVRLLIRAQQIELADKQGLDISGLLSDLDRMMEETQSNPDAQFGALGAAGSITIRFGRKYPSIANRYLLALLRSAREVVLPDGSRPDLHYKKPLESLLWMTANSAGSDADVESWIATLREFSAEQIRVLDQSDLAADSCVVLCDQVWLREFRKPEYEQDWPSRIALVQKIEKAASTPGWGCCMLPQYALA